MFFISLAILSVILGTQVILRSFVIGDRSGWSLANRSGLTRIITRINADKIKLIKYTFVISAAIVFAYNFYLSYQQYQLWAGNELTKNLLPPHTSINYFLFYVFTRFFAPYLISLTAAILFFFFAKTLNKKYEERFFEKEEYYFGALSIFLVGHPGWLFYIIFLVFVYLVVHIFRSGFTRITTPKQSKLATGQARKNAEENAGQQEVRISLRYLWMPTAIFVIIISGWLENLSIWQLLKF